MSFNWSDPQFANLFSDLGKPAPPAPFVPSFEPGIVYRSTTSGDLAVNDEYYATADTAKWLQSKYGASRIEFGAPDSANPGPGGADVYAATGAPAYPRLLVFSPGSVIRNYVGVIISVVQKEFSVIAGQLAKFYRNDPEDKFPAFTEVVGTPPNVVSLQVLSLAEQYVWRELLLRAQG